jgi:hypothetical protein
LLIGRPHKEEDIKHTTNSNEVNNSSAIIRMADSHRLGIRVHKEHPDEVTILELIHEKRVLAKCTLGRVKIVSLLVITIIRV